jgi:hypothetical protein
MAAFFTPLVWESFAKSQREEFIVNVNLRRRILVLAATGILVSAMGIALVSRYKPEPELLYCGHPEQTSIGDVFTGLLGGRPARHHCLSSRTVHDLRYLALGQEMLRDELSRYATNIEELISTVALRPRADDPKYFLHTNGLGWSITAPQQGRLAGSYLLTSNRHLYFNATRAATTNDLRLHDWSK